MKTKIIILGVALAAIMSSCGTTYTTQKEVRFAEATAAVNVIPPTCKVDVNPVKFEDTWVFTWDDMTYWHLYGAQAFDRAKTEAMAKSMMKYKADIIIAPLFDVNLEVSNSQNTNQKITVKLSGYTGKYVDWDKNASSNAIQTTSDKK